ncbi:interleukin-20 receptor subunit alpha [Anableps anableps]
MWTELIFVGLFVLRCAVSSSPPKPINVSFSSVNLRNVLQWSPGNGTPDGTHFTVEYAIYGDTMEVRKGKREHWRAVHQCTNIVRTWCDLSAETWAEEEGYYARVCALGRKSSSKWTVTKRRFDPKSDTIFGPPLVSVEMENNSAIVTLKGPMRYFPNNHTPPLSMKAIYRRMSYNLSIYNTHRNQMYHFPVDTSMFKYQMMDYNTEYCFSAKSRFLSIPLQCESSAWHCITTPQDPVIVQMQQVVMGIVVPSLCICIIVLVSYLLYNYLSGKGQKSPFILNQLSFHPSPIVLLPDKVTLQPTRILPNKPPPSVEIPSFDAYPEIRDLSQRPAIPREPEEPMNNLSKNYGFVIAQKKVGGKKDTTQRKLEKGDAVNNLKDKHQKFAYCDEKKDVNIKDDHSASGYKPQAETFRESPEVSDSLQNLPCSQRDLVLTSQSWAPMQSNQRSFTEKQTNKNNTESSGLYFAKSSHTGALNIHLSLPLPKEELKREEIEGGEQKQSQCENVPLLSGYASQNIPTMPTVHSQQSDCLSGDYCAVTQAAAQKAEAGNDEMEICSNSSSESIEVALPIIFNKDRGTEEIMAGNFEEMYTMRSHLKLENVFLRQASDEEAGAQIEEEMDNVLRKWDLVISMDE